VKNRYSCKSLAKHTYLNVFLHMFTEFPIPDFESPWRPIINGPQHVARIDLAHGLGETPVLVDVQVKVGQYIVPAVGMR